MLTLTNNLIPIETVNWDNLVPIYPYRFNGPGYLYCVDCEHFIRLLSIANQEVLCSDCEKVLANSTNQSIQQGET